MSSFEKKKKRKNFRFRKKGTEKGASPYRNSSKVQPCNIEMFMFEKCDNISNWLDCSCWCCAPPLGQIVYFVFSKIGKTNDLFPKNSAKIRTLTLMIATEWYNKSLPISTEDGGSSRRAVQHTSVAAAQSAGERKWRFQRVRISTLARNSQLSILGPGIVEALGGPEDWQSTRHLRRLSLAPKLP